MSLGLPSLDLNMDGAAPQKDANKDLTFKPASVPASAGTQVKTAQNEEGPAGAHRLLDVSASLLEGGSTPGFDSTKPGREPAKSQSQDVSIPNSSAFWESGQNKDGRSLVTGRKFLGSKRDFSISGVGDFMAGDSVRKVAVICLIFPLIIALFLMKPELLNSIPGWNFTTGEASDHETTDQESLGTVDSNESATSEVSDLPPAPSGLTAISQDRGLMELTWQENPYWFLPNDFDQNITLPTVKWNPEQEEAWGASSEGSAMWAKYQTLFEIRKAPPLGAEEVLWKLSKGKKFWLRIMSLMALAEMGQTIETAHVEQSIEGVSQELMSRFVKRFEKKSTVGERLILRFLLKLVNEDARLSILKGLAFQKDRFSYLYLVAGTYDPGISVSSFSKRQILKLHPEEWERLKKVVTGDATFEQASPNKNTMVNETPENAPANLGEPLKKELNTTENAEAVDSATSATSATSAASAASANADLEDVGALSEDTVHSKKSGDEVRSVKAHAKLEEGQSTVLSNEDPSAKPLEGSEEGMK